MSQEARSAFISLIVNVTTNLFIALRLRSQNAEGAFGAPDALSVWAKTVLWAVPLAVGGTIAGDGLRLASYRM